MREVLLGGKHRLTALVDDDDHAFLSQWKWTGYYHHKHFYAERTDYSNGKKKIKMHRLIMKASKGEIIDHADGDGLNNQKANLRFCTRGQNRANSTAWGKSIYLGVYWAKDRQRWRAKIKTPTKSIELGRFKEERDAAFAYNTAAKKYHKEFAKLNIIQ